MKRNRPYGRMTFERLILRLVFLALLAVFLSSLITYLKKNPDYYGLDAYTWESDEFRAMALGEVVAGQNQLDYDQIATLMSEHRFDLGGLTDAAYDNSLVKNRKPVEYQKLKRAYESLLSDLKYFPIPLSTQADTPDVGFENSWNELRTYGGERGHEGCDIMGTERSRGFYPVVSMSDGVIEKVGWLEKGGWRLGIRTEHGVYLYYAHLYSYSRDWKEGDTVRAGDLLGFMGDSGYSKTEGAVGNFAVHLHLGIYLKTDHYEELSVNPYWILKYLLKFRLKSAY